MAEPGFPPESQLSNLTLASGVDESFKHDLTALPPVQQWSDATIESIRSIVSAKYPGSEWQEESEWTRRLINVILASREGWNWQRLKTCSNTEYFSLPPHVSSNSLVLLYLAVQGRLILFMLPITVLARILIYNESVSLQNDRQSHYSTRSSMLVVLMRRMHAARRAITPAISVCALGMVEK